MAPKRQRWPGPPGLTPERHRRLVELVREGNHLTTAAAAVGTDKTTLHKWLRRGERAQEAIANGEEIPESELRYVRLRDDMGKARAEAEVTAVDVVSKVIQGGYLLGETETITYDGTRTIDRRWAPPDGKLALEFLARSWPDRWGRQPAMRLDPNGDEAPALLPDAERVNELASRLRRALEQRQLEQPVPPPSPAEQSAEEVVDAEIVDTPET